MPDELKVLVAPGHAPDMWPMLLTQMTAGRPDAIFTSEFYRLANDHVPGYRVIVGGSHTNTRAVHSPRGDAGDNPILLDARHTVTRQRAEKVDSPAPATREHGKFAPERWGYSVDIDYARGVCLISVHPSPLFVGRAKWLTVMRWARGEVRRAQRMGLAVILAGDLQTAGRLVPWMLRGFGMKTWRVGVCWLAWSGLREVPGSRVTKQPKGMDHEWFGTTLVRLPKP
jgi:hypothetical protein